MRALTRFRRASARSSLTPGAESTSIRIVEMPDLGAVTDACSVVGEHAGSGRFSAPAFRHYMGMVTTTDGDTAHSLPDHFAGQMSVTDFGAVGDGATDDTAAIQATVNYVAGCDGGGVVYLRRGNYKLSAAITVPLNCRVQFRGEGMSSTILRQTSSTADGIVFVSDGYASNGGGVCDLTIEAGAGLETSGFTGAGSSGCGLRVTHGNDNFVTRGVGINNFSYGIALRGCWNTRHSDLRIMYYAEHGFDVGAAVADGAVGGGNSLTGAKISNLGFTGPNTGSVGIYVSSTGGDYFNTIDITSCFTGVVLQPPPGSNVAYLFFNSVLADTCTGNGWYIDGSSGGYIYSIFCTTCWASYCAGNGMHVVGPNVQNLHWTAGRLRENSLHGLYLGAGSVQVVGGAIVHNSRNNDNTYPGVRVGTNVSGWGLVGVRIGNNGESAAVQAEGVVVDAGSSDYFRIIGCDLSLPGAGKSPLANGGTSNNAIVSNNLPTASAGLNPYNALTFSGCSLGVPAATTTFLGPNGADPTESYNMWRAPRHGVISLVTVFGTTAPGAGQSFTLMLRVRNGDTGMTGTISGASATSWTAQSPAVTVNTGDAIGLRVVSSGTAAMSPFSYSIRVE